MAPEKLDYEHAAEVRTLSGWVCKICGNFWGKDERMARYCCAKLLPCQTKGCKGEMEKGWAFCKECREKKDEERYWKRPEKAWDGRVPLVEQDDDRYFFSPEDMDDYMEENGLKLEDMRLVICEPCKKPLFSMGDFLSGYFEATEESDFNEDPGKIEKAVNDWIEEHVPVLWEHGKYRPTLESVRSAII
jgi:hypothetical protein